MATTTPISAEDERIRAVTQRADQLERELEEARRELQQFIYAASHDLQEPLRAVSAYSKLLERLAADQPEAKEYSDFITSSVTRMNTLLQNLVAYSRISMAPALKNVSLSSVVHATMFKLGDLLRQVGAKVQFADLPDLTANELQLCQLFEQIFLNSIHFRGDTQPLEIHISAAEDDLASEPAQVVCIRDNGPGIDPQFLAQVVTPFKRLHGKEIPGNGLGLSMADKIMKAHHGKFWLHSDGKTGTAAYLAFQM